MIRVFNRKVQELIKFNFRQFSYFHPQIKSVEYINGVISLKTNSGNRKDHNYQMPIQSLLKNLNQNFDPKTKQRKIPPVFSFPVDVQEVNVDQSLETVLIHLRDTKEIIKISFESLKNKIFDENIWDFGMETWGKSMEGSDDLWVYYDDIMKNDDVLMSKMVKYGIIFVKNTPKRFVEFAEHIFRLKFLKC